MDEALEILSSYYRFPGGVESVSPGGGTAGKCWQVITGNGKYLLRRRGSRTSEPSLVERDHKLRDFLLAHGVLTTVPVAALDGMGYVLSHGSVYELHPFVEGHFMDAGNDGQLQEFAHKIAEFHQVANLYRCQAAPRDFDQFGAALPGFSKRSRRLDDVQVMHSALSAYGETLNVNQRAQMSFVLNLSEQLTRQYDAKAYSRVDRNYVHGDLNLTNVLFGENGKLAGLFDFDWAMPGPRIRDVADAIHFFAGGLVGGCNSSDIWELTRIPRFDKRRTRLFLAAYNDAYPLTEPEMSLLPFAWQARVLAFHIEGMAKVPQERRLDFLTREMEDFVHNSTLVLT